MELLEVLLWIIGVFVVLGAIIAIVGFLGLRKLWRYVDDALTDQGKPGPGDPPLSRRRPRTGMTSDQQALGADAHRR